MKDIAKWYGSLTLEKSVTIAVTALIIVLLYTAGFLYSKYTEYLQVRIEQCELENQELRLKIIKILQE